MSHGNIETEEAEVLLSEEMEEGDEEGDEDIGRPATDARVADDAEEDEELEVDDDIDVAPSPNGGKRGSMDLGSDGTVAQLIDIREPLYMLRRMLERRFDVDLSGHEFWLQDSQPLSDDTTLVEQCVQGEGLVQIKMEIKSDAKKINIVDVLKPAEDEVELEAETPVQEKETKKKTRAASSSQEAVTRWEVSVKFREKQEKLKIPKDPYEWRRNHVWHWIKWAIEEFPRASISLEDWDMTGKEVCLLSLEEFRRKVPIDPGDLMWTHLELLRKCRFVAVVQTDQGSSSFGPRGRTRKELDEQASSPRKTKKKPPVRLGAAKSTVMSESALGNRTGNNGQVQLWQFLLDLLTDKEHINLIHWIGEEGEFKLESPELVAQLWGVRKNKPNMNYEKLSRALRYYYDGDMISKVAGKRFVYKFVCDLKQLIGYTAAELNCLVRMAARKASSRRKT